MPHKPQEKGLRQQNKSELKFTEQLLNVLTVTKTQQRRTDVSVKLLVLHRLYLAKELAKSKFRA